MPTEVATPEELLLRSAPRHLPRLHGLQTPHLPVANLCAAQSSDDPESLEKMAIVDGADAAPS